MWFPITLMPNVGYARVSSTGQDLAVQFEKLEATGCEKVFKEKRSGVDTGRPELKRCLEYLREGDSLLVTKIDRLARSTSDLYWIISQFADKGVAFRVLDDPSMDTTSRTGKLVMGILALIAEFENDIRRERQMDGIAKAKERGIRFVYQVNSQEGQGFWFRCGSKKIPQSCREMQSAKPNQRVRRGWLRPS